SSASRRITFALKRSFLPWSPIRSQSQQLNGELRAQFVEQGYAGPVRVLVAQNCGRILDRLCLAQQEPPSDWHKGYAVRSWAFYEVAKRQAIVGVASSRLEDDLMLWCASI